MSYASAAPAGRMSAPPSVQVVALLHYLAGLSGFAAAGALAFFGPDAFDFVDPAKADNFAYALTGVVALFALLTMLLGRKLQRGRQWARVLVTVLCAVSLAGTAVSALTVDPVSSLSGALFPVLYLILLNTRAARSWFRYRSW